MFRTLKRKILMVYLMLVLVIAAIGALSVFNMYYQEKVINELMTDNYKSISAISKMSEAIERQDSAMLIYTSIDANKGIAIFTENGNLFLDNFAIEQSNITETGERELVDELSEQYNQYTLVFSQLQEVRNKEGEQAALTLYNSSITPVFSGIKAQLKELTTINETAMFNGKDKAAQDAQNSMYVMLSITTVAVIVGFLLSKFFSNRFLKPLYQLAKGISKVGEGSLDQRIEIKSTDETGVLAKEFNKMTERLKLYEQSALGTLMDEKNKSLAIVKSISDPLIVLDNKLNIEIINNACESYFGIEEEKVIGKNLLDALRNEQLYDIIGQLIKGEKVKDTTIYLPKGEGLYFNIIVSSIQGRNTSRGGHIVLLQNVTELKKLEKARTDFIATVSHEFKTPLTSILMGTGMLVEQGIGLNEEQAEIVDAIKEDGERLSTLVNDLLELSRIESGKAVYHVHSCSINAIAEESFKQFIDTAERKHVELINDLSENLPNVYADFEKISWVLNNLLSNALKYTDAGDSITVSAEYDAIEMTITVEDTGIGIPAEYVKTLFDKFIQVKGQDIEVRGTGLGLSVVREIITAHKGEIWVESELDAGSQFHFTLPIEGREENK